MSLVYFVYGFIFGAIIFGIYFYYRSYKWKGKLEETKSIFQLVESSKDVIYYYEVKPKMKFRYLSPSLENFLGEGILEEAFKNPNSPFDRIHPDDYEILCRKTSGQVDYSQALIQRWRDIKGNYRWFEEYATPVYENGEFIAIQGIMRNIDEKVKLQQELIYQVHHDSLTNIHNRKYFDLEFTKLNEEIDTSVGIILCDLDELKNVNDNYGHKMGDELIKLTASLLTKFSSDTSIVARIGGDEFALIVTKKKESEVKLLVSDIRKEFDRYNGFLLDESIKISIGHSYASSSIGQMKKLFAQADKNMYVDKNEKKKALV